MIKQLPTTGSGGLCTRGVYDIAGVVVMASSVVKEGYFVGCDDLVAVLMGIVSFVAHVLRQQAHRSVGRIL